MSTENQPISWEPVGSGGGGRFQSIDFSARPNANGSYTAYLGGDTCGLFKSEDDGATWVPVNAGLYDFRTSRVVVRPDNPSVLYAATSGGLFRSGDAGGSWTPVDIGRTFSTSRRNNALASLALAPSEPDNLYVGTGNLHAEAPLSDDATAIYRSTDGGATWERVYQNAGYWVSSIAVNPRRAGSVYAALSSRETGGILLHSADFGKAGSWTVVDTGRRYHQLGFDLENHLFVTSESPAQGLGSRPDLPGNRSAAGPYVIMIRDVRDDIAAGDFVDITPPRVAGKPRSTHGLAVTPQGTIFVADPGSADPTVWRYQKGVWLAMDRYDRDGSGWADFTSGGRPWVQARCLGAAPDGTPWHGGSMQIYRWGPKGWEQKYTQGTSASGYRTRGNSNTVIFSRDMIFLDREEYYWGPGDIYVEGTKDGGKACIRIRFPDPDNRMNDVRVLTADRQDARVWYVVTHLQDQKSDHAKLLRRTADGTWQTVLTSTRAGSAGPFKDPTVPRGGGILDVIADGPRILISTYEDGVHRSTDGGTTWGKVRGFGTAMVSKFARSGLDPDLLMAAASGRMDGIWRSRDGGGTWSRIRAAAKPHYAVAWAGSTTWYASEQDAILRTQNDGRTWKAVYKWLNRPDIFDNRSPDSNDISVGIVDPREPDRNPVAAAFTVMGYFDHSSMGGLALSTEGGAAGTWRQPDLNGVTYHGWGVEFNPFDPSELFYLTYGSGLYRSRLTRPVRNPALPSVYPTQ